MLTDKIVATSLRFANFTGRLVMAIVALIVVASFAEARSSVIQLPKDVPIVDADDWTRACMAEMACVRDIFLKLALGNEHESPQPGYEGIGIIKATGPTAIQVIGADRASEEAQTAMKSGLLDTLAILRSAGVDIIFWTEESQRSVDFAVFVSDNFGRDKTGIFAQYLEAYYDEGVKDYEDMMRRAKERKAICTASSYFDAGPNIIGGGMILIPSDMSERSIRLCFYEEIIQALGPGFDFHDEVMSIFTDRADVRWFSEFDYLLTRLFFHPMIKPGMSREQVNDLFPELYRAVLTAAPLCPSFDACLKEIF